MITLHVIGGLMVSLTSCLIRLSALPSQYSAASMRNRNCDREIITRENCLIVTGRVIVQQHHYTKNIPLPLFNVNTKWCSVLNESHMRKMAFHGGSNFCVSVTNTSATVDCISKRLVHITIICPFYTTQIPKLFSFK